jgi:hypothetical protein
MKGIESGGEEILRFISGRAKSTNAGTVHIKKVMKCGILQVKIEILDIPALILIIGRKTICGNESSRNRNCRTGRIYLRINGEIPRRGEMDPVTLGNITGEYG